MRLADTYANAALDAILGSGHAAGFPATVYVGLSLTEPQDDGTGITEPAGNGYARVAVVNNDTNWPDATGRQKTNGTDVTFPAVTTVTDPDGWGAPGWWVLMDASTGTGLIIASRLTEATPIEAGADVLFPAGSLVIDAPATN